MGQQLSGRPGSQNLGITTIAGKSSATAPDLSIYKGFTTPPVPVESPVTPLPISTGINRTITSQSTVPRPVTSLGVGSQMRRMLL